MLVQSTVSKRKKKKKKENIKKGKYFSEELYENVGLFNALLGDWNQGHSYI